MPQMKPMKWMYISLMTYLMFFSILCLINSFPLKLNLLMINKKSMKFNKWNWLW